MVRPFVVLCIPTRKFICFLPIWLLTVERHWKCTSIDLNWIRNSLEELEYCYRSLISRLLRYQLMLEYWTNFGSHFRYFCKLYCNLLSIIWINCLKNPKKKISSDNCYICVRFHHGNCMNDVRHHSSFTDFRSFMPNEINRIRGKL